MILNQEFCVWNSWDISSEENQSFNTWPMWRTGPVCIHSGRAEESFGPRVHREHQGCGSCSGRGEPEMLGITNRGRSFRWSFWTLSPFTPSCQAFVAAQSQVVSDWSLRAAWKSTLRHFLSFGQSQVKVLLEAVARQKQAETQTEEPTRTETRKKIWRPIEMNGEQPKQLWVSVQSFCLIPDFLCHIPLTSAALRTY